MPKTLVEVIRSIVGRRCWSWAEEGRIVAAAMARRAIAFEVLRGTPTRRPLATTNRREGSYGLACRFRRYSSAIRTTGTGSRFEAAVAPDQAARAWDKRHLPLLKRL
jgi:hypothetical protein